MLARPSEISHEVRFCRRLLGYSFFFSPSVSILVSNVFPPPTSSVWVVLSSVPFPSFLLFLFSIALHVWLTFGGERENAKCVAAALWVSLLSVAAPSSFCFGHSFLHFPRVRSPRSTKTGKKAPGLGRLPQRDAMSTAVHRTTPTPRRVHE